MSRDLSELKIAALMLDGVHFAEQCGAKALAAAVRKVFGSAALIQRCTLHKRRNVKDHLPKDQQAWVDRKLASAFNHEDPVKGERAARDLAKQLEDRWPDAA